MYDWKQQQIREIMEYFGVEHKEPSEIRTSERADRNGHTFNAVHSSDIGYTEKGCVCNARTVAVRGNK